MDVERRIHGIESELRSRWVPNLGDRINNLEARFAAQDDVIAATSTLLDEERRKNVTLATRIKHLEAVVYAEGEPEGHGLVDEVQ